MATWKTSSLHGWDISKSWGVMKKYQQQLYQTATCPKLNILQLAQAKQLRRQAHTVQASDSGLRVFAVSDIHTNYADNMQWVKCLEKKDFSQDALILAGDICEEIERLRETLKRLSSTFGNILYVPGNHEAWVQSRGKMEAATNSVAKLNSISELCKELGVHTSPVLLADAVWLVPLLSWHHRSWDSEPDIPGVPAASGFTIGDYASCVWPDNIPGSREAGSLELAEWWDSQNPNWTPDNRDSTDCITVSHFLPRQELLPEKRFLYFPNLAKAAGSDPLARRVTALQPDIHIFGHTHFGWDTVLDGVRYIQAPLCTPSERRRRLRSLSLYSAAEGWSGAASVPTAEEAAAAAWLPALVYQTAQPQGEGWERLQRGWMPPTLHASWSAYYAQNARDPTNVELAPWAAKLYSRRLKRAEALRDAGRRA